MACIIKRRPRRTSYNKIAFKILIERRKYYNVRKEMNKMKNLIAGGFLFVGGGILMNTDNFGNVIPFLGAACALIGVGMLIYFVFSDDGKYG